LPGFSAIGSAIGPAAGGAVLATSATYGSVALMAALATLGACAFLFPVTRRGLTPLRNT
jgi:hypothetical protein